MRMLSKWIKKQINKRKFWEYLTTSCIHTVIIMRGVPGSGKCHKKGTKILMYDGSIKNVEDIVVGDQVMGVDSKPRNVLNLSVGIGEMYSIIPNKGADFSVNGQHILVLKKSGLLIQSHGKNIGYRKNPIQKQISVDNYLKLAPVVRDRLKLFRTGVDFAVKKIELEPYFLGLWLGDGKSNMPYIYTMDKEIKQYIYSFAQKMGATIRCYGRKNNRAKDYRITYPQNNHFNPILNLLRQYNLINNKHIPKEYLTNSRKIRLKVLAGLIDSDGYHNKKGGYQISTKFDQLKDDILYLCRSLGFAAYSKKVIKGIKSSGFKGEYWNITISGNTNEVPVLLPRKKAHNRKMNKDVLVTGFKVESLGVGDYYGFETDGDHRYLLSDFTVMHNSTLAKKICKKYNGIIHSTDNYFIDKDGKYKFNADMLMENHRKNYDAFCKNLNEGTPIVIVDNTNIRHKWYREYVEKANEIGYQVIEVLIDPDYCTVDEMYKRNKHNVPKKIVENMYNALKNNMKPIEGCQKQFII